MKRVLLASSLIIFSVLSSAKTVEQLIESYVPNAQVGLFVQNADNKEILYLHHQQQNFTPASVTKSFTTAAALLALGPEFSYQTQLVYNHNQLHENVLQGDLALVFTGDPTLTTRDLENLLQHISKNNIKKITGNIIIDNTYFTKPYTGLGWVAEDSNWYFGTPAKAVIIDENQMAVQNTDEIELVDPQVANTLCSLDVELKDNNMPRVYGCWPKDQAEKLSTLKVALANPELRAQEIITQSLKQQGIVLNQNIIIGPSSLPDLLASYQSPRLEELNTVIMKESNNLYADSLTKVLGKQYYQRSSLQAGARAIIDILNIQNIRLFDGSGGSTYNQITPERVAMLLQSMYDNPKYNNTYLNIQKVDEQHRFHLRLPENFDTQIYLKTGSMTGVSNMAGYIKTKSGKTLIFVCLLNRLPEDKTKAREFEQALIQYLAGI